MSKRPKEPKTFKHPRLYARFPVGKDPSGKTFRIRIIEPDGNLFWDDNVDNASLLLPRTRPCWAFCDSGARLTINPYKLVQLMKAYDKKYGYETVFLGEIK